MAKAHTRHDLQDLQEHKEMIQEAKAELLSHNHVLHPDEGAETSAEKPIETTEKPSASVYIKQLEDVERIAQNSVEEVAHALPSPLQQIMTFQIQIATACMYSWSEMLKAYMDASLKRAV